MNQHRLYRSADDRLISGVAAGVAEYFEVDPVLVRILWFISVPITGGLTFLAYIVMMIVVPIQPEEWPQPSPWAPGGGPIGYEGGYVPPTAPNAPTGPNAGPDAPNSGTAPEGSASGANQPDPSTASAPGTGPGTAPFAGPTAPTDWRWQRRQERRQRRQERWQYRADQWDRRGERHGTGSLIFGLVLIILGGAFALSQIDPNFNLNLAWPVAIIAIGALLVLSSVGRAKHD